jgi:hypothetical protein
MPLLAREEYVEQAYLFRALGNRMGSGDPVQDLLLHLREEILATTKLPMAIDYLKAELSHVGTMGSAMAKMPHYFSTFQSFLVQTAESERGRFDMTLALKILELEAQFRAEGANATSLFFYQFESLCRNRLSYDHGLKAMADDPIYDEGWRRWILGVRHKLGMVELSDLVYVHSQYYLLRQQSNAEYDPDATEIPDPVLFGEKEGRIALANRNKEPLYFFSALQRHMNYPAAPRHKPKDAQEELIPKLVRTVERLEVRIKLLEDEQRAKGIDLSQFFERPDLHNRTDLND